MNGESGSSTTRSSYITGFSKKLSNSSQCQNLLRCYYHNPGGLRTKISDLKRAVEVSVYDIIFLTETWFNDNFSENEVRFSNFEIYRCDCNFDISGLTRGGGVLIAVSS